MAGVTRRRIKQMTDGGGSGCDRECASPPCPPPHPPGPAPPCPAPPCPAPPRTPPRLPGPSTPRARLAFYERDFPSRGPRLPCAAAPRAVQRARGPPESFRNQKMRPCRRFTVQALWG
ncbi:hypothetical protein R5R35_007235 [Gryllus longicercus]|uniref:Uncharacterized protein n=1 Tax=Gryllus longicercus TaxID=2509291 RepID=A0AAN9V4N1_9ORTH